MLKENVYCGILKNSWCHKDYYEKMCRNSTLWCYCAPSRVQCCQCEGVKERSSFRRRLSYEDSSFIIGVKNLMKEVLRSLQLACSSAFCHLRKEEESVHHTADASVLILAFLASRTVRNKCLLFFNHPWSNIHDSITVGLKHPPLWTGVAAIRSEHLKAQRCQTCCLLLPRHS